MSVVLRASRFEPLSLCECHGPLRFRAKILRPDQPLIIDKPCLFGAVLSNCGGCRMIVGTG
jgi:hypothetical protein